MHTPTPEREPPTAGAAPAAIILAAGLGKRMGSDRPKVVHEVAGRALVAWVVGACRDAGVRRCVVVIGHRGHEVRRVLADQPGVEYVEQGEQLGTGHAAQSAAPAFADRPACDVFVLAGDAPLIRPATLQRLLETHRRERAAATLATSMLADPTGYGRIVRDAAGRFVAIVEQKDCTPQQALIREVNPSYYCFRSEDLFAGLARVRNHNAQREYYLTDVPGILAGQGQRVALVEAVPAEDVLGINTPLELARVDAIMRTRLREGLGAAVQGPA